MSERSKRHTGFVMTARQRDVGSLLIAIHFFCVFIALFGRESSSELATRVYRVLGPYLRLVNLDHQAAPGFHWTHGLEQEDDHELSIRTTSPGGDGTADWDRLSADATGFDPLAFRRDRWKRLAQRVARLVEAENDEAAAELALAIGREQLGERNAAKLEFRCRLHGPDELQDDFAGEVRDVYVADVWRDPRGQIRVHKQISADQAAPVVDPVPAKSSAK